MVFTFIYIIICNNICHFVLLPEENWSNFFGIWLRVVYNLLGLTCSSLLSKAGIFSLPSLTDICIFVSFDFSVLFGR